MLCGCRAANRTPRVSNNSRCSIVCSCTRRYFSLSAGIFIGAIWGQCLVGTLLGLGSQEVWALITMLIYSFALHPGLLPVLRRPRPFHWFVLLAFLSVLFTYFGVNFLLGGMHSYA